MLNDDPNNIPAPVSREEMYLQKLAKSSCDNDVFCGDGGGGLPAVTKDDNGKFMRVVNGAWVAVSVPNAEEASF